jgi:hypothetical protein
MDSLATKLLAGVRVVGEQEDLIKVMFPSDRVSVVGERETARGAELPERIECLANALLFEQRDPIGMRHVGAAKDPAIVL